MRVETDAPASAPGALAESAATLGLREVLTITAERLADPGAPEAPARRVAVIAVVANPLAGRYEEDLGELVRLGEALGRCLVKRALALVDPARLVGVGKAALVGQDGELEHASALSGAGFARAVRQAIGPWKSSAPSARKLGGPDSVIEVVLQPRDGASGTALEPLEIRVQDRPRDDEAIVVLALAEASGGQVGSAQP